MVLEGNRGTNTSGRIERVLLQQTHLFRLKAIAFCTGALDSAIHQGKFAQELPGEKQEREACLRKYSETNFGVLLPEYNY